MAWHVVMQFLDEQSGCVGREELCSSPQNERQGNSNEKQMEKCSFHHFFFLCCQCESSSLSEREELAPTCILGKSFFPRKASSAPANSPICSWHSFSLTFCVKGTASCSISKAMQRNLARGAFLQKMLQTAQLFPFVFDF